MFANPWTTALFSTVVVSLISLSGAAVLVISEKNLRRILFILVALSVGALLGDALIHLLPEVFQTTTNPSASSLYILAGMMLFFVLEKFLHWQHSHDVEEDEAHTLAIKPLGYLSLVSDGLHNFIDGVVIGVSYLASPAIGLASTVAIILHEIPQEVGDMALLLQAGFSRRRALLFNLLSALIAILGTLAALLLGGIAVGFNQFMLPLAAGGFIYVAGSDLVPELHKITDPKKSAVQLAAIIFGASLMLLLLLVG